MTPTQEDAINEETELGWYHLFLSFFSSKWQVLLAADRHHSKHTEPPPGKHRIQQVLIALFNFTEALWLGCNDVLHKGKDLVEQKVYSIESAELCHNHDNPHLLPHADQHYCTIPLNRLLQSQPSSADNGSIAIKQHMRHLLKWQANSNNESLNT